MGVYIPNIEKPKSCENCVNCDKVKPEGKDEFWTCDEYGAVYLTAPANCTPPNDCACDFWTDDPAERHKRYNMCVIYRW